MDFKQLQSFVTVVRFESFSKAAEKLFLSQPTVSAHIQALEKELNQKLLIRTTKNLELTDVGRRVYEYADHILELKERVETECMQEKGNMVRVGASTIPSTYILPRILPDYKKKYPNAYFVVHQSDSQGILEGLLDGLFDVGLVGMKPGKQFRYQPICSDKMVLITPIQEPFISLHKTQTVANHTLLQEPIILREDESGSQKAAEEVLESIGLHIADLHVVARINDQETIKNLVACGLGVSVISSLAATDYEKQGKVLCFQLPDSGKRDLYLVYNKSAKQEPQTLEFVEYIQHKAAEIWK